MVSQDCFLEIMLSLVFENCLCPHCYIKNDGYIITIAHYFTLKVIYCESNNTLGLNCTCSLIGYSVSKTP